MTRKTDFQALRSRGADLPHGRRLRYLAGCKCMLCRATASRYESKRLRARRNGDWNGIVDAGKVREHLRKLSKLGVGYRQVASVADVSVTVLCEVKAGSRKNVRARTERRVLAVDATCRADKVSIPAGPTWRLIEKLLKFHFHTKQELAQALGYSMAIQFGRGRITVRNAHRVAKLYRRYECPAPTVS